MANDLSVLMELQADCLAGLWGYSTSRRDILEAGDIEEGLNAAAAIGRSDKIGSVEPGKQADLLILDAPDYRHLGYRFGTNLVHTVIKKGRIFKNGG